MIRWLRALLSGDDREVSVLHVVCIAVLAVFGVLLPAVVAGTAAMYALRHGWSLMPGIEGIAKDLGLAFGTAQTSVGAAWSLKGLGGRLESQGGQH